MESFALTYLNGPTIASALAALAMFGTILSLSMPLLKGDKLETRLKAVTSQREKLRKQSRARLEEKSIRREAKGAMADITKKLNLATLLEDPNVEQKLSQAGFRGPKPIATFYFFRFSLPFVGALLMFLYVFFVNDFGLATVQKYSVLLVGAAIGFYAPNLYISNVKATRQKSIMKAFPDALDMMLICVESGMSIEMAFAKVGSEVGSASAELAEENREMRMSEAEKKAAALPAKLTVPMIVFFLPVLFLVVLGPAYIKFQEM